MSGRVLALFGCLWVGLSALHAQDGFRVRAIPREPRLVRGDENVRKVQPADEAAWIWMPGHRVYGVMADGDAWKSAAKSETLPSWFFRFRNDFEATDAPLRFDVTADERFVLYLDGREIARGPERGLVAHWCYHTYEVTALAPGRHRLEAVCWQLGALAPLAQISYRGGFLLKAEGAYDAKLTTGRGPWRVAPLENTVMTDRGTSGTFGVGTQCRVTGTGFPREEPPASRWTDAVCVRGGIEANAFGGRTLGWMLYPADRPESVHAPKIPGRTVNAACDLTRPFVVPPNAERDLWWDLDDYYCAYPELETAGGKGACIRWGWCESLRDGQRLKGDRGAWRGKRFSETFTDTFVCDGRPDALFTTPWWRCGRWCRLQVKTADDPVTIRAVRLMETHYPLQTDAAFACDDAALEAVYRLSHRTLVSCMHEMMFDCPFYEQQMYPGDTRIELQILNALTRDARMPRFAMSVFDWDRRDNGLVAMNFPTRGLQESATYTMCWIMMFADYLMWHDDLPFLRQRMPGVRNALMGLALHENASGLLEDLPGWSFMDWVRGDQPFKVGVAPCGAPHEGCSALNNLLYLLAVQSAAKVDDALGERHLAAHWRAKAQRLADVIRARFWDAERGILADTAAKDRFSEHAQALGILAGVLAGDARASALSALIARRGLAPASSYFAHYLFEALVACDRTDVVLERLAAWRNFIDWGARTCFETQHTTSRSDCHAWSACPIYFLHTAVAGVRPDAPCFARVRVAPRPGALGFVKTDTPSPKGVISCAFRFAAGRAKGHVTLPAGLTGEFEWHGARQPLKSGRNAIDLSYRHRD